jgi:hypothetical protein
MRKNLAESAKLAAPPGSCKDSCGPVTVKGRTAEPAVDKRFGYLSGRLCHGKNSMPVKKTAHWGKLCQNDRL